MHTLKKLGGFQNRKEYWSEFRGPMHCIEVSSCFTSQMMRWLGGEERLAYLDVSMQARPYHSMGNVSLPCRNARIFQPARGLSGFAFLDGEVAKTEQPITAATDPCPVLWLSPCLSPPSLLLP